MGSVGNPPYKVENIQTESEVKQPNHRVTFADKKVNDVVKPKTTSLPGVSED